MTLHIAVPTLGESPDRPHWVRVDARVTSDRDALDDHVWLDVPGEMASSLSVRGEAFLAWFAPVAAVRGETLVLDAPTDSAMVDQVREVMRVWRRWYPDLEVPTVEAPSVRREPAASARTLAMFTGGVDSFFTVLRHTAGEGTPRNEGIDDLCFVQGFDIPLANTAAADRVTTSLREAATLLGRRLVVVATNLRDTVFRSTNWAGHSHGAALAGVAHALSDGYDTLLLGSTAAYDDPKPWGSHPLTDPMFRSERLRIVHDGAAFVRAEKIAYIAQSPVAQAHLRVCWQSTTGENCGTCVKCLRTMLTLEALGVLGDCPSFAPATVDLARVERVYCREEYEVRHFRAIRALADRRSRADIVAAVDRALAGSTRLTERLAVVQALRARPVIRRWAPAWEQRLLRGWIV